MHFYNDYFVRNYIFSLTYLWSTNTSNEEIISQKNFLKDHLVESRKNNKDKTKDKKIVKGGEGGYLGEV